MYRDCMVTDLSKKESGKNVTLSGWVDRVRDHGGVIFIDLRDRSGKIQILFHPESESYKEAKSIRNEFVISIKGEVKLRGKDKINSDLVTGEIEVECSYLKIINRSDLLPFEVNDNNLNEVSKFKYRYLNMRNPKVMNILKKRSDLFKVVRDFLSERDFLEIDTPILTKATPEGARDFLVPSRINQGKFYALPQSPQIFKQILMYGGVDRYYQIAKCFRDEDLRADRQPEFLQLDIEMSFVTEEDVMKLASELIRRVIKELLDIEPQEVKTITFESAMELYGSDKPDLSFDMKLIDLTDIARSCGFKVFNSSKSVKGLNVKNSLDSLSRKDIESLTEEIKDYGAKGLAWIKVTDEGYSSLITKFFKDDELNEIVKKMDAKAGDTLLFVADERSVVNNSLGFLRTRLADILSLRDNKFHLLWVTDFPMFEWSESENRHKAMHHPFTAPKDDDFKVAKAYDLVLNGSEIAGGSIRVTNYDLQMNIFNKLGIDTEEAERDFEHLLTALKFGAPPHGGIAFGLDRLLAILLGESSIREVIPFPKTQKGISLLTDAPSEIKDDQLSELSIQRLKIKK